MAKKKNVTLVSLMVFIFWLTEDVVPQPTAWHFCPTFGVSFEIGIALKLPDILNGTSTYAKEVEELKGKKNIRCCSILMLGGILTRIMAISLSNVAALYFG